MEDWRWSGAFKSNATFKFTPAEVNDAGVLVQPPRISTISISSRGSDSGELVTELLQGWTNCDEDWMKGVLKPAL